MRKYIGLLVLGLVLIGFQNCGRVAFDSVDGDLSKAGVVTGPPVSEVVIPDTDDVVDNEEEVVIVDDKKDDVVVVDDKKDEEKKNDDKKDEDKKDDVVVVDDEEKKNDDKKDEDKKDDNLTEEEVDLIACENGEGGDDKKVLICHIPPGNPAARHTICIGRPALKTHADHHGDTMGACPAEDLASAE